MTMPVTTTAPTTTTRRTFLDPETERRFMNYAKTNTHVRIFAPELGVPAREFCLAMAGEPVSEATAEKIRRRFSRK